MTRRAAILGGAFLIVFASFSAATFGGVMGSGSEQEATSVGVAFVFEEDDPREGGRASGRFSAHWEADSGSSFRRGPTNTDVKTALAWARRQSPMVLIRLAGSGEHLNAGTEDVPEADRRWPWDIDDVRARPHGEPVTSGRQEVEWLVTVRFNGHTQATRGPAHVARDRLAAEDTIRLRGGVRQEDEDIAFDLAVKARGTDSALAIVDATLGRHESNLSSRPNLYILGRAAD